MLAVYLVLGAIMFMLLGNYYGNRISDTRHNEELKCQSLGIHQFLKQASYPYMIYSLCPSPWVWTKTSLQSNLGYPSARLA